MKNYLTERISSDTAESLTISQIVWIVFTIVVVLAITQKIYPAIVGKGDGVKSCINQSNTLFTAKNSTECMANVAPGKPGA